MRFVDKKSLRRQSLTEEKGFARQQTEKSCSFSSFNIFRDVMANIFLATSMRNVLDELAAILHIFIIKIS